MITYKKLRSLLYTCLFIFSPISSMDDFKQKVEAIKNNTPVSQIEMASLIEQAQSLGENKDTYRKVAPLLHPDRTGGNLTLEELLKAANRGNEKNRSQVTIARATAEDIENGKILDAADRLNNDIKDLKECSVFNLALAIYAQQAEPYITQGLADRVVDSGFAIISDKLMIDNEDKTEIRKILKSLHENMDTLKDNQESIKQAVEMHAEYQKDLSENKKMIDAEIEKKLKKLHKKMSQ